jgi:PKD domain/Peptidase M66
MKTQELLKWSVVLGILIIGGGYLQQRTYRFANATTGHAQPQSYSGAQVAREAPQVFTNFSQWLETFSKAPADHYIALATEGLELARSRRTAMETLIRSNPQQALKQAVTLDVWKSLPRELQAEVEEPFSALANFRVLPICRQGSADHQIENPPDSMRWTEIEGQPVLESFVFGHREGLTTKEKSPIQGIRLGNLAALHDEVFHELTPREATVAEAIYPLATVKVGRGHDFATGKPIGPESVTTLAGGRIFKFSNRASLAKFNKSIAALDDKPGPHSGAAVLFLPKGAAGSATGFDLAAAVMLSDSMASAWTETKKKVFMIRCDFSDKPDSSDPVVNAGTYTTVLNTEVSNNIRDFSYGKTWIEATVSSNVIRLPQPTTYYDDDLGGGNTRNAEILSNAKAAYQTANPTFVSSGYDIIGIWFVYIGMKGSGVSYGGLAGGSDIWIQGTSDASLHIHEFGHNYGLGHSSYWTPASGSTNPVDPAGTNEEYGDVFDVMGDGSAPEGVFHSEAKQRLNWLATGTWTDATAAVSATHRLYRIDHPNTTGVRGLRVTKGDGGYYWLSYRRQFANSWLKAGANIVWQRSGQNRSWLIDTTPGSIPGSSDRTDGSIAIGRTYSDGNNHITPLARGGVSPNEYLDIRVNTGPFPGNVAPTVTLNGPSALAARQTCIFTASATDGNGDALAYSWDFGQGFTFDNNPSAAFAWNSGGTYTVKVTVSDMKGNNVQATKTVTVSDPITTWTARTNTSVGNFKALVASPNRVIAVGEDYNTFKGPVATSTDGMTWTATQLGSNQQAFAGIWDGSQFLLAGTEYSFSTSAGGWLGCVYTSPTANSGSWTRRIFSGSQLRGIAFGNGVYVAVGDDGTIHRSTDGINWTQAVSGTTNHLSSVSYGGGKFVAVGHSGGSGDPTVLTSTNGSTWTKTSSGSGLASWQDFRNIQWLGDRFISSGWYSKLRYSIDTGTTFSTTRATTEEMPGLAYGNGVWFAAGISKESASTDLDLDLLSTDGVNWTTLTTPALDDRNAAVFFKNTFITAGDNHSIRQSAMIPPSANGYFIWRELNFPDHGPLSALQSDSDGDSLSNLMEYSLARSPLTGSGSDGSAALPQAVIVASEPLLSDRIALQVSMPEPAAADLSYVVEASSSLSGSWTPLATKIGGGVWTWNPGGTSHIVQASPVSGRILVKIGDSVPRASQPTRFLRLRTQVNP